MEVTFSSLGFFGEILRNIQQALLNTSLSPSDSAFPALMSLISISLLILVFVCLFKRTL